MADPVPQTTDLEALRRRVDRSLARDVIVLAVLGLSLLGIVLWVVL